MLKQYKNIWAIILVSLVTLSGCSDLLNVEPDEVLLKEDFYKNKYDAEVIVRGIYGQLMEMSDQILVLNELRADLVDVTVNSNQNLRDLNVHNVSLGNAYADPLPFYKVINNCNDALSNFTRMKDEKLLLESDYSIFYSEVGAVRSWLYLNLAIQYGKIPYVTEPIVDITDVKNIVNLPKLSIQEIVVELIDFVEKLPYRERYVDKSMEDIPEIIYINKYFLLGDLYLWNNDYLNAAINYKTLLESYGSNNFDRYRVVFGDVINHNDLAVGYIRYQEDDVLSLIVDKNKGWRSIFTKQGGTLFFDEWIWTIPYDNQFEIVNPFIKLFANEGEGEYLVCPSKQAMYYWNSQVQMNQIPFDARGELSWQEINGEPVITKFIDNYDSNDPFNRNGMWYLNRAALLHLRFAEAANRDGHPKLASALLNHGIKTEYDVSGATDITNLQRTLLPFPYDFDGRQDQTGQIPVGVRGPWHKNAGIRGRANLQAHILGNMAVSDSILTVEKQIVEEVALELAFEGHRWGDLVRIALRNNDPSFLANKVADKLAKSGTGDAEAVRARLMDSNNWFLPFPNQ